MNHDDICQRIRQLYPDATTTISGADCSFEIVVVAEAFAGMPMLKRQRSIMKLFHNELHGGRWHALTVKTRTPAEQARQA